MEKMPKVVILCGGQGTRLREETENRPKPLIPIGEMPILWHIMKIYSHYGFTDFVLCLGYKSHVIKEFFANYERDTSDYTLHLRDMKTTSHKVHQHDNWNITFAETGELTHTGGRVKAIQKYIGDEPFMLTYGDGLGTVDIRKLWEFHKNNKKMVTMTCVHPQSRYGILDVQNDGVQQFMEKPPMKEWINGGFMVCNPEFFNHVDNTMFELTTLPVLAKQGNIGAYLHEGFWYSMDTYKDYLDLTSMWKSGTPAWKIWRDE